MFLKIQSLGLCLCIGAFSLSAQQFELAAGQINTTTSDSRSINFIDLNNDGWIDVFVSNGLEGGQKDLLYLNDGKGLLKAVNIEDISSTELPSDGATFADYNNDGYIDAAVSSWYGEKDMIYLNDQNGQFIKQDDIGIAPGSFSETAAFGDYDGDGLVDLYITNSAGNNRNYLYKNLGNGKFSWQKDHILAIERKPSRGAIWTDMNNDGHLDLFVANEGEHANDIYYGTGNGEFEALNRGSIVVGGKGSMTGSWGDIDNDGDFDVFIGNSGFFSGQKNQLYKNFGDSFGVVIEDPVNDPTDCTFGSAFGDYDNDGDLDLAISNGFCNTFMANRLYENQGDGSFVDVSNLLVGNTNTCSFGIAWGDVDNNGFLDLMVANCKNKADDSEKFNRMLMNLGNENNWMAFSLTGTLSNTSAIGAKVRLKATIKGEPTWQIREVRAQSGYAGQNSPVLHFGLEQATQADSIVIIWPSGLVETLVDIPANQKILKTENITTQVKDLATQIQWTLHPNPIKQQADSLSMMFQSTKRWKQAHCTLFNAMGQMIQQQSFSIQKGWNQYDFKLASPNLDSGVYFLVLQTKEGRMSQKLVVQ